MRVNINETDFGKINFNKLRSERSDMNLCIELSSVEIIHKTF